MMDVQVFLSATLRAFVPEYDPAAGRTVALADDAEVREVCRSLGIPEEKVKIVMVNGRNAELADRLAGGERVALFPPVGGG
jgi:molybdopterin synthase sulfur carrier subunit